MTKIYRLALALPVAALMSAPAMASTFFEFNYTWNNGYSLIGQTAPGDNAFGEAYAADTMTWSFGESGNMQPAQLLGDGVNLRFSPGFQSGDVIGEFGVIQSSFTVTDDSPLSFTRSGQTDVTGTSTGNLAWTVDDEVLGFSAFALANNNDSLRALTLNPDTGDYQYTSNDTFNSTLAGDPTVASVPEINGSGFAYIAFILGALGLWLYSGAGRARQEDTPAVA